MSKLFRRTLAFMLGASSAVGTAFLWETPLLLAAFLSVIAIAFCQLRPHPRAWLIYLFAFVFGPLAEALAIFMGAWQYTAPDFLGVPLWLPFLWGNAALFISHFRTGSDTV